MSDPGTYADAISRAIHADAGAARAEIRAEGVVCPSCEANMADLPDGHMLVIRDLKGTGMITECRDGVPATLLAVSSPMSDEEFGTFQAAASIAVWDDFRRREAESFRAIIGDGPAEFTGIIGILNADRPASA